MNTLSYIVDKYNLKIGRQYIVEIPNIGRNNLAELFAELKFKKGAEIGVALGEYSEVLCKVNPKLHLFSIDPWSVSAYEPETLNFGKTGRSDFNRAYKEARKRLAPYNCTVIRKTSMKALKDHKDNSLDFVYIDGNHDFVNFTNDLHYWSKKVRKGGIISGHDYIYFPSRNFNHVKRALIAYLWSYGIKPLFIVGAEAVGQPGVIRDKTRSWFWIKG